MPDEGIIQTPAPGDLPTFTIVLNGRELPHEVQVLSITVIKAVNRISLARVVLADGDPSREDFPLSSGKDFIPGVRMQIQAGYHSHEAPIFEGIILKQSVKAREKGAGQLSVDARHTAVKLTQVKRSASYSDVLDSDVFGSLLSRYGITADVKPTETVHATLIQYASTDWDFLLSRAEANGMMVYTNLGKVEIRKPDFSGKPAVALRYGSTMLLFEADLDARGQVTGVKGEAWDLAGQELIVSEGQGMSLPRLGNIESKALAQVMGDPLCLLGHGGHRSEQELRKWADARLIKAHLARIRGRVKCTGVAEVNPGGLLELQGVGDRFSGKAFVSGVRHEIREGTWTTEAAFGLSDRWFSEEFQVSEQPATGLLPAVSGLQIGVVSGLEGDPEGEARIKVTLPLVHPDAEGVWSRIASLDAGDNRGSFFRPEIGDEVVLGFLNDDPRDPVVLGMLHSSAKPPPTQAADTNNEKGFVTRSGMRIWFHDEKKRIAVETPGGRALVLDDDAGSVELKDASGNQFKMDSDGIALESAGALKIKAGTTLSIEGVNAALKGSGTFTAEGSGSVELKSAGTMVIKGSIVQIN